MTCCGVHDDGTSAVPHRDESANAATPADRHVIKATAIGCRRSDHPFVCGVTQLGNNQAAEQIGGSRLHLESRIKDK
ncbi:MAG TPA: hypothetical protein VFW50_02430 [Streptosporangiaceae bacterium]|nr:hypothetical protein [Streptosporangiaceae bacterium]